MTVYMQILCKITIPRLLRASRSRDHVYFLLMVLKTNRNHETFSVDRETQYASGISDMSIYQPLHVLII